MEKGESKETKTQREIKKYRCLEKKSYEEGGRLKNKTNKQTCKQVKMTSSYKNGERGKNKNLNKPTHGNNLQFIVHGHVYLQNKVK